MIANSSREARNDCPDDQKAIPRNANHGEWRSGAGNPERDARVDAAKISDGFGGRVLRPVGKDAVPWERQSVLLLRVSAVLGQLLLRLLCLGARLHVL